MTTTVIVKTHVWPVQVDAIEGEDAKVVWTTVVAPNSEERVYVHSQRQLHITELPEPTKD